MTHLRYLEHLPGDGKKSVLLHESPAWGPLLGGLMSSVALVVASGCFVVVSGLLVVVSGLHVQVVVLSVVGYHSGRLVVVLSVVGGHSGCTGNSVVVLRVDVPQEVIQGGKGVVLPVDRLNSP